MKRLTDLNIHEISILTSDVSPAVGAARVLVAKHDDGRPEPTSFDEAVAALSDGRRGTEAMQKARELYPELFAAYQAYAPPQAATAGVAKADAVLQFDRLVHRIAKERRVTLAKAMSLARVEYPNKFAAYQAA